MFTFERRYSFFAPSHTYVVRDADGRWLGEVARNAVEPGRWWASNITWSGGHDFPGTYRTRRDAAQALRDAVVEP